MYVSRNNYYRVSVLAVNGTTVEYTGTRHLREPASLRVGDHECGRRAHRGQHRQLPTGRADTLSVIDVRATPPRLVNTVNVGLIPEASPLSPDSGHLAVALNGSNLAKASPFFDDFGLLRIYRVNGTELTQVAETRAGRWCQGTAWTARARRWSCNAGWKGDPGLRFDGRTVPRTAG